MAVFFRRERDRERVSECVCRQYSAPSSYIQYMSIFPIFYFLVFFVLHRTKCKQVHPEWERFSDFFVLHRTKCKSMHFEWQCFSDDKERERARERESVCVQTVQCTL